MTFGPEEPPGSAGAGAAVVHTLVIARCARLRMIFILRSMGAA
jgi:hypothetical protein